MVKVYVIYDQLYEKVIAVRSTEDSASKHINELNNQRMIEKNEKYCFDFDYDEFEVLD